jgi:hypothetical protein
MLNELNKKIWLDLLVTPATVLPFAGGLSLAMLGAVVGASWGFLGIILCLIGVGAAVTNVLFNYEHVSLRAINQLKEEEKRQRNEVLDALDVKLSSDRDPRDQEALRNLRGLYDSFREDVAAGKISVVAGGVMFSQIDQIFNGCVKQLEKQHEVWLASRKVTGEIRDGMMKRKSDIMDEVEASIETLAGVMNEVRGLGLKAESGELTKLQNRLRNQLDAAKATEEIVQQADASSDLSRFREYEGNK